MSAPFLPSKKKDKPERNCHFGVRVYNTLTKKLEGIEKKNHINFYTCGPTVYNYAHIGNLRSFIMADLLYRTLKYEGYKPHWVMNITDIDDKTIKGAIADHGADATVDDLKTFTEKYLKAFREDLMAVNVLVDEIEMIRVTDKMKDIQKFITQLMDKGYAYKAEDGIYFSIEKYQKDFGDYGELVGKKFLEGKKVGARVKVDEYEKENLSDFVVWKAYDESTDANIYWEHDVLGKGRPGWHIECSVINHVAFKGEPTDIHTGGVDLVFPHHTNEIAQSQALLGKGNFVKHWFHSEHLLVDGKKMAKRDGNVYRLEDLKKKGFSGQDLRYAMFSSGYRVQQNFTWENLLAAHTAADKLLFVAPDATQGSPESTKKILNQVRDDMNISEAVGLAWKDGASPEMISKLFGLVKVDEEITDMKVLDFIELRKTSRGKKDFAKADELRKQIEALGYEVMDTPEGQKVKKKIKI